jgi:hypothetical protein
LDPLRQRHRWWPVLAEQRAKEMRGDRNGKFSMALRFLRARWREEQARDSVDWRWFG